jgi:hypothetical protein
MSLVKGFELDLEGLLTVGEGEGSWGDVGEGVGSGAVGESEGVAEVAFIDFLSWEDAEDGAEWAVAAGGSWQEGVKGAGGGVFDQG